MSNEYEKLKLNELRDLAKEKGITPSISRQEIEAREYARLMPMKEATEWYSLNGMTGDEIRQIKNGIHTIKEASK